METAPPQPKQRSVALRIFLAVCGAIVLLAGIAQTWKGVNRLSGGSTPEFKQLMVDSDESVKQARLYWNEATPLFQQMMNDIDSLGLEPFRAQRQEVAAKTSDLLGKSSEQFLLGQKQLEDSKKLNKNEKMTPWLESQARSYGLFAQRVEINREIIRMALDPSIASIDPLLAKMKEAVARGAEIEKNAKAASAEAAEIAKQIKAETKK